MPNRLLPTWVTTSRAVHSSQGAWLDQLSGGAAWTRSSKLRIRRVVRSTTSLLMVPTLPATEGGPGQLPRRFVVPSRSAELTTESPFDR